MLSESASAQLTLVSTSGTQANPVFHYDITVTDTGTTNIGTFWFSWIPGEDFLPSIPSATSNPAGWTNALTGNGNQTDGTAIEWVASSNPITPGHSLSGFDFTTTDSPTALAGNSPSHSTEPVLTSFVYSGAAFSDAGFQFLVSPAATTVASTTTLASSAPSATAGTSVTLTATVTRSSGTGPTPTGTVSFTQDGNALGTINVAPDGTAALATSTLPVGTDHITATYSGDSNYSTSASAPLTETITPNLNATATTTTVASSLPSAPFGTAVTFTATVTPASGAAVPTGTVTFSQDGSALGSGLVQADGTATFTTASLPVGDDSIVATYGGDNNFAASASAPLVQTITQPATLVPTIASSKIPPAIVAGVASKGSIKLEITNDTGANIKGKGTVALYASTSGEIDGSAVLLTQVNKTLSVKTTKPGKASLSFKIAAGELAPGVYTLIARVTDPSGNINDSAAGGTVTVAAPFIQLSETVTKNKLPVSAASGLKAHGSVTLAIANAGNIVTPPSTTVALFATTSGSIDNSATQLVSLTKSLKIKPGKTSKVTLSLKVLPVLAAGTYTIVAQVTAPDGQITTVQVGSMTITA